MQSLGYVPDLELEDEEIWTIRCLRTPRVGFRDLSLSLTQFLLQLSKKRPEDLFKLVESRVEVPVMAKYLRQLCLDIQKISCVLQLPEMLPKQQRVHLKRDTMTCLPT